MSAPAWTSARNVHPVPGGHVMFACRRNIGFVAPANAMSEMGFEFDRIRILATRPVDKNPHNGRLTERQVKGFK
jgi:hypothetical protein